MRIGIDLDDTLVNTSEAFDIIMKKYNVSFNKKYNEAWTEDEADFILRNYFLEVVEIAQIKKGAKEAFDYLNSKGHELIIITARSNYYSDYIEMATNKFIEKEKLKISKICFNEWKKSDIAKQMNIDLMIDDSNEVYNNMQKEGIDCILLGDKIKTWQDVLEYIKGKE